MMPIKLHNLSHLHDGTWELTKEHTSYESRSNVLLFIRMSVKNKTNRDVIKPIKGGLRRYLRDNYGIQ